MTDVDRRTRRDTSDVPVDLSALRHDDALLDRLGAGSTESEDSGDAIERLLTGWVRETRRIEAPAPARGRPAASPRPTKVMAVRHAFVGAAVLVGTVAGGSGVAAAFAGDPLAGFPRLQQAVVAAESGPPLDPPDSPPSPSSAPTPS